MKAAIFLFLGLAAAGADLRVLSFNVRYPATSDGPDLWENRKDLLVETIRRAKPDLIGTQELFHHQGVYIVTHLKGFSWFGRSRRGNTEDEHMGVFYRTARLELLESGDFWLSETPDKPGTSSWNMSLPRMVTWALFRDKKTGRSFRYFNTHFAHRREDEVARQAAARLIASRLPAEGDFLLTGDFNAPAGGDTYRLLVPPLEDTWVKARSRSGPEGTFHGFKGKPGPARIDWILFRAPWKVKRAEAITYHQGGRYPSDHFPVLAVFSVPWLRASAPYVMER